MKIAIIVEGKTEKAFKPFLKNYLERHLRGNMPRLDFSPYDGRIPTKEKLRRLVEGLLGERNPADQVVALTDVYTGSHPPDFVDAADAKGKMRAWVGQNTKFHPHAAQYDFEAWLIPYWPEIQNLAGHNRNAPSGNPETINHNKPPAYHIAEIFRIGKSGKAYVKARDAARILKNSDLSVTIARCPQLKAFINTILKICGAETIP